MDGSIPRPSGERQPPVAYEFGAFRLEPSEQRLVCDGQPLPLPHRAFDLLVFLVQRSGHLVTKKELLETLWSGLFVEESNITQNIFLLRRALTNGASGREYIETVPRGGYRFIAPVREVSAAPGAPPALAAVRTPETRDSNGASVEIPVSSAPRPMGRRRRALVAATVGALILAAASIWLGWQPTAPPAAAIRSIAVLPLKPLEPSVADDSLGLGIAEAVVSRLARSRELVVRPLSSSRQAALSAPDAAAAGKRLAVDGVLEGTLQRSEGRVRATLELVRVRDGRVLWSESLEEPAAEAFRLEDSVSDRLVAALGPEIGSAGTHRGIRRAPANRRAYEAYLRGRLFWNGRTHDDLRRAVVELEDAVREDPGYALAWSGLADAYVLLGPSVPGTFPKAKEAAEKALMLDPDLAEAHASLGFTRFFFDWDFPGAERDLREAIELDPGYATAHQWYAFWLAAAGRSEAAVAEIQRARDIDPLSLVLQEDVGHILIYAHRYPEAVEELRHVMAVDAAYSKVRVFLVAALVKAGRFEEAESEISLLEGGPDGVAALGNRLAMDAARGRVKEARAVLPALLEAAAADRVPPDGVAAMYAALGDGDEALAWLERAFRERRFYLVFLRADPQFDSLRADPRFADLVARIGIPS